jgi:hypothetical protein
MNYKAFITSTLLLLLCFQSASVAAATWTNGDQEVQAVIWRPGYHGFYVSPVNFHDPENCRANATEHMYLFSPAFETENVELMNRLYSLILISHSTKKKLHVFVDGCEGHYPRITGLQLN